MLVVTDWTPIYGYMARIDRYNGRMNGYNSAINGYLPTKKGNRLKVKF